METEIGKSHAAVAREALAVLERDGWCKYYLTYPPDEHYPAAGYRIGSHCIGGAVNIALHGDEQWRIGTTAPEDRKFMHLLAGKIREQYPDAPGNWMTDALGAIGLISAWNNSLEVTESDIRRVLEKIAADEE